MTPKFIFNKSAKSYILKLLNKKVKDGIIVDADTEEPVISQDGEVIRLEEFAGVKKGSEIYIKNDVVSLIKLYDSIK